MIANKQLVDLLHAAARIYPEYATTPQPVPGLREIYISRQPSAPLGYVEMNTFLHEYKMFYVFCLTHAE